MENVGVDKLSAKERDIAAGIAKKTGVKEADVTKVLKQLGLEEALKTASAQGSEKLGKLSADDAKISFKAGKT